MTDYAPTEDEAKFIRHVEAQVEKKINKSLSKYGADMQQIHTEFRDTYKKNLDQLTETDAALAKRIAALEERVQQSAGAAANAAFVDKVKALGWKSWGEVLAQGKQPLLENLMEQVPKAIGNCKDVNDAQRILFSSAASISGMLALPGKPATYVHLKRRNAVMIGTTLFMVGGAAGVYGTKRASKRKEKKEGKVCAESSSSSGPAQLPAGATAEASATPEAFPLAAE